MACIVVKEAQTLARYRVLALADTLRVSGPARATEVVQACWPGLPHFSCARGRQPRQVPLARATCRLWRTRGMPRGFGCCSTWLRWVAGAARADVDLQRSRASLSLAALAHLAERPAVLGQLRRLPRLLERCCDPGRPGRLCRRDTPLGGAAGLHLLPPPICCLSASSGRRRWCSAAAQVAGRVEPGAAGQRRGGHPCKRPEPGLRRAARAAAADRRKHGRQVHPAARVVPGCHHGSGAQPCALWPCGGAAIRDSCPALRRSAATCLPPPLSWRQWTESSHGLVRAAGWQRLHSQRVV